MDMRGQVQRPLPFAVLGVYKPALLNKELIG